MLLDPQAISMMPPELENNPMTTSQIDATVAIQDLMQRTSLENEEVQTVGEAVEVSGFAPKGSLV